ncbi:MAG: hypothetical protein REU00_09660 [Pseudomonadota bacterium]|nr:hypothetical protein [Pseudomonadota bacterium]
MPLRGTAALAMWWDMAPDMKPEFEHWHSHEHFPERLGVPGFRRASRWTSAGGGEGVFVMYEVASHAVLSSQAYVDHLNSPTPWSTKMMPHHRHMVRSQCHVLASAGSALARHALTLRLSPLPGRGEDLLASLRTLCEDLAQRPGLVGAHLLRHQTPDMPETTEQRIRQSADRFADRVLVVLGYTGEALERLLHADLSEEALRHAGAADDAVGGLYTLSHSASAEEFAGEHVPALA